MTKEEKIKEVMELVEDYAVNRGSRVLMIDFGVENDCAEKITGAGRSLKAKIESKLRELIKDE